MGRPYVTGSATADDPLRYEVTDEFLVDLESGRWAGGMFAAAVQEIRRLRKGAIRMGEKWEHRSATGDDLAEEIVERNARAHESLEEWCEAAALWQTLTDILHAKINRSLGEE